MKKWIGGLAALVVAAALLPAVYAQQDQSSQPAQPSAEQPSAQPSAQQPSAEQPSAQPSAEQPSAQPDMTPQASPSQDTTAPSGQAAPSGQDTATPAAQGTAFTGTIVNAGGKYVLKTDTQTYQLDDQDKAKTYENKQVSVVGSLDQSTSVLHVTDIMPATQQ
jgi:hypothetical protein